MDEHTTPTSKSYSAVDTTPSARLHYKGCSLSPKEKRRVDSADAPFNRGRCLVENHHAGQTVQYCHMIARKFTKKEKLMESLEWYWNMPYRSLHLNTRYNVFFAGPTFHLLHDSDCWGLLPDTAVIDRYFEVLTAARSKFPDIQLPDDGFQYKLVPLSKSMEPFPILRQNEHTTPPNENQFTLHFYPFQTLPSFRSHLHPKFAIFELGRKLRALRTKDSTAADAVTSLYPDLHHINLIYAVWAVSPQGYPPFNDWKAQSGPDSDDDGQSESSSRTGYDSWRKGSKRRRTGDADEHGSPTPAGGKPDVMQMANLSCETLSHETLVEYERVCGKGGWTPESLSNWAANASRHVTT